MTTTIENYLTDGIISFAFPKIDTYTNERGEIKKKPIGMPNWRTINKQNCLFFNTGSAYAVVTGEMSNLTIFDFDSKVDYERLIEKHPDLKTYKTIKTNKKGFIFGLRMTLTIKQRWIVSMIIKEWIFAMTLVLCFAHRRSI